MPIEQQYFTALLGGISYRKKLKTLPRVLSLQHETCWQFHDVNFDDLEKSQHQKPSLALSYRYIVRAEVGKKSLLTKDCIGLYYLQTVKSHVRSIKLVLWFWGVDNVLYNSQP